MVNFDFQNGGARDSPRLNVLRALKFQNGANALGNYTNWRAWLFGPFEYRPIAPNCPRFETGSIIADAELGNVRYWREADIRVGCWLACVIASELIES
jgi:hypothetical protein